MYRTDYCTHLSTEDIGRSVTLSGWVMRRRDLGKITFVTLRDSTGVMQLLLADKPGTEDGRTLNREDVVRATGIVAARSEGNVNPEMATGEIELDVSKLEVINRSDTPPFLVEGDGSDATEETRLRYRYVDIRRERIHSNLVLRHRIVKAIRDSFSDAGFLDIETPFLTKSTPEGARDFLVPSRMSPGQFYALPQSPQLFKQLLMIGGIDRYFQIVKCFRDEDLRADRQPEFTQLDLEVAFPRDKDEIASFMEDALVRVFESVLSVDLATPFARLSHSDAYAQYGTDKPDLRFGMRIHDISSLVENSAFRIFSEAVARGDSVCALAASGCSSYSRSELDELEEIAKKSGAAGLLSMKVGRDITSPIAKFISESELSAILQELGAVEGDLVLICAGKDPRRPLGELRREVGRRESLAAEGWSFIWITDFPLFGLDEQGNLTSEHHPFTSPQEDDLDRLESHPLSVLSNAYDLVLNGVELGSGSIRIHSRKLQERIFRLLGITEEEAKLRFGFFLHALDYGAPPHGGFALGLDRLAMMMTQEESLRDVIAFPKTATGFCPLTEAPMPVNSSQLEELGIRLNSD